MNLKEIEEHLKMCLRKLDGIQEYDDAGMNAAYKLGYLETEINHLIKKNQCKREKN